MAAGHKINLRDIHITLNMNTLIDKVDELSRAFIEPEAPPLSAEEVQLAAPHLIHPLWRTVTRVKTDPLIRKQEFGLISFTPARGATPDKYGLYGVAKLRGNFLNENKANAEAERIIRDVDSINEIYTVKVGQSFPITKEVKFIAEFETVDLSKEVTQEEKDKEESLKKKETKEKKVIVDREKQLLIEHKEIVQGTYEEDPLDVYIRAKVKTSQLKYTLEMTEKKIETELKPALERAKADVKALDEKHPEMKGKYLEHYLEARREAGLETEFKTDTGSQMDFMKYLADDE